MDIHHIPSNYEATTVKHVFPGQVISNQVSIGVEGAPPRSQDPLYPKVKGFIMMSYHQIYGHVGVPLLDNHGQPHILNCSLLVLPSCTLPADSPGPDVWIAASLGTTLSQISAACDCLSWFIDGISIYQFSDYLGLRLKLLSQMAWGPCGTPKNLGFPLTL